MINSLLSLIILGGSSSEPDEMRAGPDENGSYGLLEEILAASAYGRSSKPDPAPKSSI